MTLTELGLQEVYLDLQSRFIGSFFAKEGERNARGKYIRVNKFDGRDVNERNRPPMVQMGRQPASRQQSRTCQVIGEQRSKN